MGALNELIKVGGSALTKTGTKAATKAVEKTAKKAVEKAVTKAVTDTATKATTKAITKALTKGGVSTSTPAVSNLVSGATLSGAGKSSLSKGSGSTLGGVLGKSSGLSLPNATKKTLADYGTNVSDLIGDNLSASDLYDSGVSLKTTRALQKAAREGADINNYALEGATGLTSKSQLPALNREQYYMDTIGKVGKSVTAADVPDYMYNHLSNTARDSKAIDNEAVLRELFGDYNSDLNELYAKYEEAAQTANANKTFTGKNISMGLGVEDEKTRNKVEQELADIIAGAGSNIKVAKAPTTTENIKISRPTATAGGEMASEANNSVLNNEIANLREKISSAGGAGMGGNGGGNTASAAPDFGGLGDSGFNVKLKNGETTNVQLGRTSTGSTPKQKYARNLDDMTAKKFNPTNKQYADIIGKSKSIDNHYKTVAERMKAENLDQANIADKAQSAISGRENIKQVKGLQYAEANGVTMDLSNIDNSIGMSATQKRKLAELGLGLDDMLGGNSVVTPTQAEEIYKTLRDYAYNWSDSKDALTSMAGKAMGKEAEAVRNIIDDTMDNINVDYKTPLVEFMAQNGEDPEYIRKIAAKTDFKFSDLRKDQSDWITMEKVAGNKIKDDPTLNIAGIDTGIKNPFTAGAEKIKEEYYKRKAGKAGAGFGGNGGSTGTAGAGASGAENNINFTEAPATQSKLQSLLNKGKTAGLVGAGVLGGLLLGGDGGSSDTDYTLQTPTATTGTTTAETSDPYATTTLGGYTYDQLEAGYIAAMQAGDTNAASAIKDMLDMLVEKIDRQNASSSTSDTKTKQEAALSVLNGLMSNYEAQGPVTGRVTQLLNAITGGNYNPNVEAYDSGSEGSLGMIIKALGDTGALSEGDQQRALKLLPKTTDSEAAAQKKYQQLVQILQNASTN